MQNYSSAYALYCNPSGARRLSDTFAPGKYDVLCARGKKAHNSEGNRRFRALVKLHQEAYGACQCKVEKSKIVSKIVATVRNASPNGGFVKMIDGHYWEAGDRAAKEKVGQTFRDLLHTKYSSSTKAKARARMERKSKPADSDDSSSTDDSSSSEDAPLTPTPPMKFLMESNDVLPAPPTAFLQQAEPDMFQADLRSSIHSFEPMRSNDSFEPRMSVNSKRNSLLRSSIHTIDPPPRMMFLKDRNNLMRSSIHSFNGPPQLRDYEQQQFPFLEGSIITTSNNDDFEKEFGSNMDLDMEDSMDEDLQSFYGALGVPV